MAIDDLSCFVELGKLETENPEAWARINLYACACLGVKTIDPDTGTYYVQDKVNDKQYLMIELCSLINAQPKYANAAYRLYSRILEFTEEK